MSGKLAARGTRGTFVVVKHANQKRTDLSKHTKRTLGSGNLKEAVRLPKGEDLNEWIATNCVDFYNEVSILYELCAMDAEARFKNPGDGFPPNFEYRWADAKNPKPIRCTSGEYVSHVLSWMGDEVNNEKIFPVDEGMSKFPADFPEVAHKIFTRIFRVYAIIYHSHFDVFESQGAASHLNTSFKHFIYFAHTHGMLEEKEYTALKEPVERLLQQYNSSK